METILAKCEVILGFQPMGTTCGEIEELFCRAVEAFPALG
jgi:hypothetical protein